MQWGYGMSGGMRGGMGGVGMRGGMGGSMRGDFGGGRPSRSDYRYRPY